MYLRDCGSFPRQGGSRGADRQDFEPLPDRTRLRDRMSRAQETQHFEQSVLPQARADFARLSVHHTVGQALKSVQEGRVEGQVVYFYVVDDDGRLQGVVPARGLLLNSAGSGKKKGRLLAKEKKRKARKKHE